MSVYMMVKHAGCSYSGNKCVPFFFFFCLPKMLVDFCQAQITVASLLGKNVELHRQPLACEKLLLKACIQQLKMRLYF